MYYDKGYFMKLVPHIRDSNQLKSKADELAKDVNSEQKRKIDAINAALRDAQSIALGLESPKDSIAYQIAEAFLRDAQAELEAAKEAEK